MSELVLIETGLYILTGAFAGFVAGLLGVGGGLIIVPVLFFSFAAQGYEQQYLMHMALTTSLATIVITSISSTIAHHKKQAVLWPIVFMLSPGIIIGSWVGGITASQINSQALSTFFAIFELLVAINLFLKFKPTQQQTNISKVASTGGGFVIGLISTMVGIGGGTMTVPFLHRFNIPMRKAVATSAACGFPIALIATSSYVYASWDIDTNSRFAIGYLQFYAMTVIACCSFIFAPIGAKVAHSISENKLRLSFASLLLTLSLIMFMS